MRVQFPFVLGFIFKRKFTFKRKRPPQLTEFLSHTWVHVINAEQTFTIASSRKFGTARVACGKNSISSVPFQLRSVLVLPPVPCESRVCCRC